MSALIHFKHVLLDAATNPALKQATLDLINAIDSDLNEQGYEHSSDVDEAIAKFDAVLMAIDEEANPTPALMEPEHKDEDETDGEGDLLSGYDPAGEDEAE